RGLVTVAGGAAVYGSVGMAADATGPVVAVDEARLTPHGVEFESEHCFCWPDLADDVEPATGTGVPLGVTLTAHVEVVQAHVAGERRDVVDEARDGKRRSWGSGRSLSKGRQGHQESDEGQQ